MNQGLGRRSTKPQNANGRPRAPVAGPRSRVASAGSSTDFLLTQLLSLFGHVLQQVDAAVAVAPLVVVPAHQLEEVLVQPNRGARVIDAAARVVDEVARDDLVRGVAEDALQ